MRVSRFALVLVFIGGLVAALVVSTSRADAALYAGRAENLANYLSVTDVAAVPMTGGQASTYMQLADLGAKENPSAGNVGGVGGGLPAPAVPPSSVTQLGNGAASGGSRITQSCSSGWGCLATFVGSTAATWWAVNAGGSSSPADTGQTPTSPPMATLWPPSYYPTDGYVYANLTDVSEISVESGDRACIRSRSTSGYPIIHIPGATDMVVKATGELVHVTWAVDFQARPEGTEDCWDISGAGRAAADVEIRRVHFDMTNRNGAWSYDKGWFWGQDFLPTDGEVHSVTRCRTPGGQEYDVVAPAIGIGLGGANIAPCTAGDTPVAQSTVYTSPSGAQRTMSTINLRPDPAGDEAYPSCATGSGCYWTVKVNGVTCAVGVPGCADWTKRPDEAQCLFGPYVMPLARCAFLERVWEPDNPNIPATRPNTDGNPNTHEGPEPKTNPSGTPSPSPSASPGASTNPSPSPTATPGGNPSPSPSPSSEPSSSSSPSPTPSGSSQPSPSPSGTGPPTPPAIPPGCVTTLPVGLVQPEAVALANEIDAEFDPPAIGGYRESANDWAGEHSSGLALDVMTYDDRDLGNAVAAWLQQNASRLGVRWIIWQQRVWNPTRADEGWRLMEDRGSATENHMDHVHVLIADQDGSNLGCDGIPKGEGAANSCLPDGWTWNPIQWVLEPTKCAIRWAFVPDGAAVQGHLDNVRTAWTEHPPGALVEGIRPVFTSLTSSWSAGCLMPNFSPVQGQTLGLPCEPPAGGVWSGLYLAMQGVLVVSTGIYLWQMVAAGVSARSTGA